MTSETDGIGHHKNYQYNPAGQLTGYSISESASASPTKQVKLSFDQRGRLTGYDDGLTKGACQYDLLGRQTNGSVQYGTFTARHSYSYYQNGLKRAILLRMARPRPTSTTASTV